MDKLPPHVKGHSRTHLGKMLMRDFACNFPTPDPPLAHFILNRACIPAAFSTPAQPDLLFSYEPPMHAAFLPSAATMQPLLYAACPARAEEDDAGLYLVSTLQEFLLHESLPSCVLLAQASSQLGCSKSDSQAMPRNILHCFSHRRLGTGKVPQSSSLPLVSCS